MQLREDEKFAELQSYLNALITIEKGEHEFSCTHQQGKIPDIKKELQAKIFKIIELENVT